MQLTFSAMAAAVCMLCAAPTAATAQPVFVNGISIPGQTLDATGVPGANQGRLGFFSDIYFDPQRNAWWGLSDRGPGGGLIDYATRVQRFTLDIDPATGAIARFQVAQTVLFTDAQGQAFNGLAPQPAHQLGRALDPEGLVVHPRTGHFLVSDEYGPSLLEFNATGQFVRAFTIPTNLLPRNAATGVANHDGDTGNTAGKRHNRGFEGLAISPDGAFAYAMLQSPMLDEGGAKDGRFARIVKFDTATGQAVAQYAYLLDRAGQGQGISALVAINHDSFWVLERNNRGVGAGAALATPDKRVYRIHLAGASDVSNTVLPATGAALPTGVVAVAKSATVIDLATNTLPALGNLSPEKWEGLAIGPQLPDGRFLLLAGTDNDYSVTQTGSGAQFDVYFRMDAPDPLAASIQCPLDQTTGCTFTTGGVAATLDAAYSLLPGVLHAYTATPTDLAGYRRPAR
nr:esterase-like activity of phytase family protein [uncultured Albidiferax sp.]